MVRTKFLRNDNWTQCKINDGCSHFSLGLMLSQQILVPAILGTAVACLDKPYDNCRTISFKKDNYMTIRVTLLWFHTSVYNQNVTLLWLNVLVLKNFLVHDMHSTKAEAPATKGSEEPCMTRTFRTHTDRQCCRCSRSINCSSSGTNQRWLFGVLGWKDKCFCGIRSLAPSPL
jgi:hypothetical protein